MTVPKTDGLMALAAVLYMLTTMACLFVVVDQHRQLVERDQSIELLRHEAASKGAAFAQCEAKLPRRRK